MLLQRKEALVKKMFITQRKGIKVFFKLDLCFYKNNTVRKIIIYFLKKVYIKDNNNKGYFDIFTWNQSMESSFFGCVRSFGVRFVL